MRVVVSLRSTVDDAIDKLPFAKRLSARYLMRRHGDEIVAHMAAKLVDEPECCDQEPIMNSAGFHGDVQMAIDPDKIAKWIELILKFLPIILAFFK